MDFTVLYFFGVFHLVEILRNPLEKEDKEEEDEKGGDRVPDPGKQKNNCSK